MNLRSRIEIQIPDLGSRFSRSQIPDLGSRFPRSRFQIVTPRHRSPTSGMIWFQNDGLSIEALDPGLPFPYKAYLKLSARPIQGRETRGLGGFLGNLNQYACDSKEYAWNHQKEKGHFHLFSLENMSGQESMLCLRNLCSHGLKPLLRKDLDRISQFHEHFKVSS